MKDIQRTLDQFKIKPNLNEHRMPSEKHTKPETNEDLSEI